MTFVEALQIAVHGGLDMCNGGTGTRLRPRSLYSPILSVFPHPEGPPFAEDEAWLSPDTILSDGWAVEPYE